MTLDARVLQKLNDLPLLSGQRQRCDLTVPGLAKQVSLDIQTLETLGGQLWEVTVEPEIGPTQLLADYTRAVAARLTGLLEPLVLIECDTLRGVAMLRSEKPMQQDRDLFFYELMVEQSGRSSLRRYQHQQGGSARQQVPFVVTREALAKGIADLATPVA